MALIETVLLWLVVVVLATMPVFALVSRNRLMDGDVARRSASALLGFWIRDWLMWVIGPVERALIRARVSPDFFNYLGVAFGIASGVAFAERALLVAGWAILLGGLADIFDGRIARARGLASRYGAFMDSTLDRFTEAFSFIGVTWYLSGTPLGAALSAAAICGSLLVSYARARGEAVGVSGAGGVMQRAERLVLLAVGALSDKVMTTRWGWPEGSVLMGVVALIAVGSMGTAIYRTASIARTLSKQGQIPSPP